jgi:hypothetical protein
MRAEHTQHSFVGLVSYLLGRPAGQSVDTDTNVTHDLLLPVA